MRHKQVDDVCAATTVSTEQTTSPTLDNETTDTDEITEFGKTTQTYGNTTTVGDLTSTTPTKTSTYNPLIRFLTRTVGHRAVKRVERG